MFAGMIALALWCQAGTRVTAPETPSSITHVLLVSVDGLRPEAFSAPLVDSMPTFARLLRGPHTLSARCDPDASVTLPNHIDMVTGLPLMEHRWPSNDDPPAIRHGGSLHKQAGRYIASVFDVAHDRGLSTGVFAGKTKFWLLEQSYGADEGAPDTIDNDDGKAKIDLFVYAESSDEEVSLLAARLKAATAKRTLDFVHFSGPDVAGHATGWDVAPNSPYVHAIQVVDRALGSLLAAIDADDSLRDHVAIVLTADHGGGVPEKTHTDAAAPVNFTIPFIVWLGHDSGPRDLRDLNRSVRAQPAPSEQPPALAPLQPIRNGDAGNLSLQLLGLPPIPGSVFNARQDLRLTENLAARSLPAAP